MKPNDIDAEPLTTEDAELLQFLLLRAMKHRQLKIRTLMPVKSVFVDTYRQPLIYIFWGNAPEPTEPDLDPGRIARLTC